MKSFRFMGSNKRKISTIYHQLNNKSVTNQLTPFITIKQTENTFILSNSSRFSQKIDGNYRENEMWKKSHIFFLEINQNNTHFSRELFFARHWGIANQNLHFKWRILQNRFNHTCGMSNVKRTICDYLKWINLLKTMPMLENVCHFQPFYRMLYIND